MIDSSLRARIHPRGTPLLFNAFFCQYIRNLPAGKGDGLDIFPPFTILMILCAEENPIAPKPT